MAGAHGPGSDSGLASLTCPHLARKEGWGFLCAPRCRQERPGLQPSPTSLTPTPSPSCHQHLPITWAFFQALCLLGHCFDSQECSTQEIRGSASDTPSPTAGAQGHSGYSWTGLTSAPASPGGEDSCFAISMSGLGCPAGVQEAASVDLTQPLPRALPHHPAVISLPV